MKISQISRFVLEQFPGKYKDLLDKLLFPLNSNLDIITQALTNNLDFSNNFNCQVMDLDVTAPCDPNNPIFIKNTMNGLCKRIYVDHLMDVRGNTAIPTSAPFVSFENNGNQIKLINITGLTGGLKYKVRLTFFAS